ncbi:hypothetical protein CRE_06679 [Caenorhabditis remanei]|uniref:Fork-head domain-containing protein n=1 Tax=Caenorhabditis remanei TaxID=31234 RepID=E3M0W9_CAERE|nr:hypothetical protein CRE_06679 [Caenorhabditis remanei]
MTTVTLLFAASHLFQPSTNITELDWISSFVSPVTSKQMENAAIRQGPRAYDVPRFRKPLNFYYRISSPEPPKVSKVPTRLQKRTNSIASTASSSNRRSNDRPPFRVSTYCGMAFLNCPRDVITSNDVLNFVLHHFKFFRSVKEFHSTICKNLKDKTGKFDRVVNAGEQFGNMNTYTLKPGADPKTWLTTRDRYYMEHIDTRGKEFYDRIFIGDVGLPRQLFYSVIGRKFPNLAGPENSALFYHLVSMKMNPWNQKLLFREFKDTEHSGNEPKFIESQYLRYDGRSMREQKKWDSNGAGIPFYRDAKSFLDKIEKYYQLQKTCKARELDNWTTPSSDDVAKILEIII